MLNQTREPLLLTVHGQVQAALIDPDSFEVYEKHIERQRLLTALKEGIRDVDEGRTSSLAEVKAEMNARYGV